MRRVCLLGASGSIGSQSLDILSKDREAFELVGFSVGKRIEKISQILSLFPKVRHFCVQEGKAASMLSLIYPDLHIYVGDRGLLQLIKNCDCDMVVNALVGFSGMAPSVLSMELGKILCLANKESLVVGGKLINDLRKAGRGTLYPIDSEHVAIAKLLSRVSREDVDKIWITASGGSFRDKNRDELGSVTPAQALAHPTWSMGAKITIDSATMMNKGFEVIEAKVLFDFPLERTHILMHKESHVHSLLQMKDGSYLADVSAPDMHGPIAYALYETKVPFELVKADSLEELGDFTFWDFDPNRYPAVGIALSAFAKGGNAPAVLNAANEISVYAFLEGKIPFTSIEDEVSYALDHVPYEEEVTLDGLIKTDAYTRDLVGKHIAGR